ncbi:MAG: hypothetical protein RBU23_00220 [Candidatus Auribacterota bacterium]|jgi:type II secretory pathway component PulJ|nr:hypothetical protein [Candidatus Auribacterota bacterium]
MNTVQARRNFTLLELLIALSLFATIMVSLYSALSVGIVAWKRGDQGSNLHQRARIILDTMVTDIRKCVYFDYIQFLGQANEVYFPVAIPVTKVTSKDKTVFDTSIFKITYFMDKTSYRHKYKSLMRLQETFLKSLDESRREAKVLSDDIDELSFQYIYIKSKEEIEMLSEFDSPLYWETDWKVKNKIPRSVKIKLVLVDQPGTSDENKITFERTVFIPIGTFEEYPEEED